VTPPPLLLTRNTELREDGIWNWTLPAWVVRLADGRSFNVCPSAGACAKVCYARNGTAHDLLAVVAPSHRIGIPANNIPAYRKRQGSRTFGELEAATPRRSTA
jgi:hypothetical protein